jgi:hypothetical protein
MSANKLLLTCVGWVVLAGSLRADPPLPLDLIPEDACIGISVRNLAELRKNSDRLFAKEPNVPRPSQLLDMAFGMLSLGWKIDEKKPSGLVCMTGTLAGLAADADPQMNQNFTIGAVLAPDSLEEVAKAYKVNLDELKKGKVLHVAGKDFGMVFGTDRVGYRDGLIYMTGRKKGTEEWMKARSVRQGQPAARQRRLDAADGLLYFGPPLLRLGQKNWDPEAVPPDQLAQLGPQEAEAQRRLNRAANEARYVLAGYRVQDGFGLDLSVGFDPKGKHSQGVIKAFTGTGRASSLAGLPDSERLVGAFAAIGLERGDLHLARVLASDAWNGFRGTSVILDSDAAVIRRIFGDLYSRLKLGRLAVYHSSDAARFGQLAAVAVLEPIDAEQFIKEITQYARLGDVEQFNPKGQASKAEIEKLVADLGSDDFQTREAATTKLALIGEDALPYLEKAEKSDDAEVRRRAEELRTNMRTASEMRKTELAKGLVKKAFRPTFTLKLRAEKRADSNIHLLGMKFDAEDSPYAGALKDLFGPDWNRLRIAVVNKQVVVLLGSETSLLEQAIVNVREGKPGLDQSAALAEFHKQTSPERRIELHLAVGRLRALLTPADQLPKDFKPTGACSSIALRSGQTDLGMDLWVPAEAVPDVGKWLRLW